MSDFSYWEAKYFWHPANYVLVGGGITGLCTSIFLKRARPKARVVLLERGAIPTGASTKNAGFACYGSLSELIDDASQMGMDATLSLVEERVKGLAMLRQMLGDEHLNYEACGGYELFVLGEEEAMHQCLEAMDEINRKIKGIDGLAPYKLCALEKAAQFGFSEGSQLISNPSEGLIDTGRAMRSLIDLAREEGVDLYCGAEVCGFERDACGIRVHMKGGSLSCDRLCIATNAFAKELLPDVSLTACRAQVLITSPVDGLKLHGAFHHHQGYDYFRHLDGRVLFGGGRHTEREAEQRKGFGLSEGIQQYLEAFLQEHILRGQKYSIERRWSGIMGMGESKEVILREVSPDVFCAVRFGGMGIALGAAVAAKAHEMILK